MRMPFLRTRQNRYALQEQLSTFTGSGQRRLYKSRIAIVGLGAIGSVLAEILARAGIGKIHLIDRDIVELENLHRQHLYTEKDIGRAKADSAMQRLQAINSEIKITSAIIDLTATNIDELKKKDLILDCTDNLETRFLINDYCRKRKIPWIHANAARDIGSIIIFRHDKESPCFRCIYEGKESELSCERDGVLPELTTIIAGLQAHGAIQELLGKKQETELLRLNLAENQLDKIKINQAETCNTCKRKEFPALTQKKQQKTVKLCGSSCYQISGKLIDLKKIKQKLEKIGKVDDLTHCIRYKNMTIFSDGRVLIKTESLEEAKALYQKIIQ
ncbi:MAG: HesA/MoeB/ThiF family protein [Nanoarchaeota archaeon]